MSWRFIIRSITNIFCHERHTKNRKTRKTRKGKERFLTEKIKKMTPVGNFVFVELDQANLKVVITANTLKEMELQTGESVVAVIKAMALTYLGPALV